MRNLRILTVGALTFFASTSMASPVHGPTSYSKDFSISLSEGYELFAFDDDNTGNGGNRFSGPVERPFSSAMIKIDPLDDDGTQDTGVAPIPVPTAVWLFGSGLIGLVAVARRRT